MQITKEMLKRIIKEELENALQEEGGPTQAYFNSSMKDSIELSYGGKKVDFVYKNAAPKYNPGAIQQAIKTLANKGKLGDIKGLAEAIFDVLNSKMESDKPTLEQIKLMSVYYG